MKKLKLSFITILLLSIYSLTSAQNKNVGVVTFNVDKYIDVSRLGGIGAVAAIATLADNPNFDLTPILNKFHDKFFNEYAKSFPFTILPEENITANPQYISFVSRFGESNDADTTKKITQKYIAYKGYKPIDISTIATPNSNQVLILKALGDVVDGVMFVSLYYAFEPKVAIGGMGSAGIQATIQIVLCNKEGKKVFNIVESAMSKKSVGLVAGIPTMKVESILPLCESASEILFEELQGRLPKIIKKVEKKF